MSKQKPTTESIDKLFLELSQFTSVITDNESKLIDEKRKLLDYVEHKENCEKAFSEICTCGLDDLLEK